MQTNSIVLEQTTQAQLKNIIRASVAEALESLRAELKTSPKSEKLTRQQLKDEFHRIGRRVLFDRLEVEAALEERRFTNA